MRGCCLSTPRFGSSYIPVSQVYIVPTTGLVQKCKSTELYKSPPNGQPKSTRPPHAPRPGCISHAVCIFVHVPCVSILSPVFAFTCTPPARASPLTGCRARWGGASARPTSTRGSWRAPTGRASARTSITQCPSARRRGRRRCGRSWSGCCTRSGRFAAGYTHWSVWRGAWRARAIGGGGAASP